MNIKDLFAKAENGMLTYEQFEELAKAGDAKFADLSEGKYVSKSKYDSDIKAKDTILEGLNGQIETLNATITTRDTDLNDLKGKLEAAGQDATRLAELNDQFSALQTKYDNDVKDYQAKMARQQYEFAVKEFANTKKFSSQAAKRDFTQAMINRNLQMEGDKLIGGEDFVSIYSEENADAFYVEPAPAEPPVVEPTPVVPEIVTTATGANNSGDDTGFHFNFTGVRGK